MYHINIATEIEDFYVVVEWFFVVLLFVCLFLINKVNVALEFCFRWTL